MWLEEQVGFSLKDMVAINVLSNAHKDNTMVVLVAFEILPYAFDLKTRVAPALFLRAPQ